MRSASIRLGTQADVEAAVAVYVRSNLARRGGDWPNQEQRVAHVTRRLPDPDGWFLLAEIGGEPAGMAAVVPLLLADGAGPPVPGACFLSLLFVIPEIWGQGIGGWLLDAAVEEARRRGNREMRLWTDEEDNERAHRLYLGRGFAHSGRTWMHETGPAGEWIGDLSALASDGTGAHRRQPGESVVLREMYLGQVWTARPATVVADGEDGVALYLPPGIRWQRPANPATGEWMRMHVGRWELRDAKGIGARTLHLMRPGAAHAVHLWWWPPDWQFGGWYVNLEEPFRRSAIGFDTLDNMLDIVIEPDRSWRWKDQDEMQKAVGLGLVPQRFADEVRTEGERVIRRLERNERPFCDGWEAWKPDPRWAMPVLPAAWETGRG